VPAQEITHRRLRLSSNLDESAFLALYSRLMRNDDLADEELTLLLTFAILFLRSDDDVVGRFGYRIILQYTAVTNDYQPLYAVAESKDLMPIVASIGRLRPEIVGPDTLSSTLFAAHLSNFTIPATSGPATVRTRGQMELRSFNANVNNAVIVAPTSYGKSEMMIERISEDLDRSTCIIVPTRALIAQTRATLVADAVLRASRVRLITHPDAYVEGSSFVAVMTQERLQRLLAMFPALALDLLLVDEAHNLLPNDSRSIELSQVILTARSRNPAMSVSFYTPFVASTSSLEHVVERASAPRGKAVNEHVKAEKIILSRPGTQQRLYDQFLNRFIDLGTNVPPDEISAVRALAGYRTLVYVNKPSDAQDLASRIAGQSTAQVTVEGQAAIRAIADLIDPSYSLIDGIRAGVLFHHGKVPDLLRSYIERLFREDTSDEPRFLVTTSTLLEGVNTPADRLIMMTPSRGRGHLSTAAFRNLIGRVGRFREVFDLNRTDLDLLQPMIHIVPSRYARSDWDVEAFLSRVADISKSVVDSVENPLLANSTDQEARERALEYLENVEPGASDLSEIRRAVTEVGKLCFLNGVHDFDIFENEEIVQERIELLAPRALTTVGEVLDAICDVFFDGIELAGDDLVRVRDNDGARRFYALFLGWRADNEPYKRMIGHFLRYWAQLNEELVYVGASWGDETYGDGFRKLYVRMRTKSRTERVNLAVAKVKEEQDFVDFNLMRYIEILNSLELIEGQLYSRLKYGTADAYLICLLKNGCSPELARLIRDQYSDEVSVNVQENSVIVYASLASAMAEHDENDILVYEAETMISAD
jgi:hypothetical protein